MTAAKSDPAVAVQLSIGDLPEFEGVIPVGVITKINGASQRITRPIHLGEKVLLLVEAEAGNIGHRETSDGVKRDQSLAVSELYELTGERAAELLAEARTAYRVADDSRNGRKPLFEDPAPEPGVAVKTDASGVVMTDAEWEEDRAAYDELEAARVRRRAEEADPNAVPFDGFEGLGARQLCAYIKRQSDRELVLAIGAYEENHANRPSVVNAATKRSAELSS